MEKATVHINIKLHDELKKHASKSRQMLYGLVEDMLSEGLKKLAINDSRKDKKHDKQ